MKIFTREDAEKFKGSHVVIPDGYTAIGERAFYRHHRLECLTLPASVTKIGAGAFSDCYNLKKIIVPDNSRYKEQIKIFEEFETRLFRGGVGVPNLVLMSFRKTCHRDIVGELNAELMRELLDFQFAPFLGEFEYISDSIELTQTLYKELRHLYTLVYENGMGTLKNITEASHPVIRFAVKIAAMGHSLHLGGLEYVRDGWYSYGTSILRMREHIEKIECRTETSAGYSFIKAAFSAICDDRGNRLPPKLFDYHFRNFRKMLPDYVKSKFELQIDKIIELSNYARREGVKGLKSRENELEFLPLALSLYFKKEYMDDKNNYYDYRSGNLLEIYSSSDYSPSRETLAKIRKELKSLFESEKINAATKEDAALMELTIDGIAFIIEGQTPRVIGEHLDFVYGVYWNDGMTWDTFPAALLPRAEEIRRLSSIACGEGILALEQEAQKVEDIFMRFALFQIIDGCDPDFVLRFLKKRIRNERACGKSPADVRLLRLTAKGLRLLQEGWRSDEVYEALCKMISQFEDGSE